jgi:hypothetical protein
LSDSDGVGDKILVIAMRNTIGFNAKPSWALSTSISEIVTQTSFSARMFDW